MNNTEIIRDLMMESPIVKSKKLTPEEVSKLINAYLESVNKVLLDYGVAQVSDDFKLEIVKLKSRNHVLRGKPYHNWRKYKLKVTTSWGYYENIEKVFNELLED